MLRSRAFRITRHQGGKSHIDQDQVAAEDPVELRIDGHPVAVLMRTPGHDKELAAGFMVTEGLISRWSEIRKIEIREDEQRILVFIQDDVQVDLGRLTRHLFTGSSCGLCGKATLDSIFGLHPPLQRTAPPDEQALLDAPDKLRASQRVFRTTGGLHAAGLFSSTGGLRVSREDIGRHNAVDKVIGHALLHDFDVSRDFLLVSGRVSFEIVQKALAARIPTIAAISAPSSLAVEFARESGQTLIGFLRPPDFNCYTE